MLMRLRMRRRRVRRRRVRGRVGRVLVRLRPLCDLGLVLVLAEDALHFARDSRHGLWVQWDKMVVVYKVDVE
jgi:hypothetical protein